MQNTAEKNVFQNTLGQFGFGKGTGVDLPYEYPGQVPTSAAEEATGRGRGDLEPEDSGYFVGDNLKLAIGGGLFAASPLQLVNGYSTFANGGDHLQPRVAAAVLAPGTPTLSPGLVDLSQAQPTKQFGPVVVNHVDIPQDWQSNISAGLVGVIKKNTFPTGTAYQTFLDYNYDAFPIAGKTGTAQADKNQPAKDSSLFVGFGPDRPRHEAELHDRCRDRAGRLRGRGCRPRREVPLRRGLGPDEDAPRRAPAVRPARPELDPGRRDPAPCRQLLRADQPERGARLMAPGGRG